MKLFEIAEDKIYHAEIAFFSRGSSRKGYYSTKGLDAALKKAGYEMEAYYERSPDQRGKPLIQKVLISGTRDEIIKQRNEINRILRIHSMGLARPYFKLLD